MPRVVLIGDSIRMGYEPCVRRTLEGAADVLAPEENGGPSTRVLANLDAWVIEPAPDVVHLNCGLHDLKREFGASANAVPLNDYAANVEAVFSRILGETSARLVWAATTPVNHAWHHARKDFDRFEEDVVAYNRAAADIAGRLGVAVNDLYGVVMQAGRDRLLRPDGVHFTDEGSDVLGRAVAEAVRHAL